MRGTRCRGRIPGAGRAERVNWPHAAAPAVKGNAPDQGLLRQSGNSLCEEWFHVIAATGLELRAGAQLLLESATFQISPGDKVGLVGRNGAGKTTLARVLAGDGLPAAGAVRRNGTIGYLPQDSRAGDL